MTDGLSIIASIVTILGVIVAYRFSKRQDKYLAGLVTSGQARPAHKPQPEDSPPTQEELAERAKTLQLWLTALRYLAGMLLVLGYIFFWFRSAPMPSGQTYLEDTFNLLSQLSSIIALMLGVVVFTMLAVIYRTERGWWYPALIVVLATVALSFAATDIGDDESDDNYYGIVSPSQQPGVG
jgi:hypothetical protein